MRLKIQDTVDEGVASVSQNIKVCNRQTFEAKWNYQQRQESDKSEE